ncbi:MAG TPA: hypothetical protein DCL77_14495 [Prolixibacteraceae bacterium]|jgi:uncharacterized protein YrzB (UPF0473 family)|nr:hypothetical protein [Prolixibacteraceae bacterium]
MSKGEELGKLLEEGELIHAQMRQLFIKNNLSDMDLKLLPEDDKKEWNRLKEINQELSDQMCKVVGTKK